MIELRLAPIPFGERAEQGDRGVEADPVALCRLADHAKPFGREVLHCRPAPGGRLRTSVLRRGRRIGPRLLDPEFRERESASRSSRVVSMPDPPVGRGRKPGRPDRRSRPGAAAPSRSALPASRKRNGESRNAARSRKSASRRVAGPVPQLFGQAETAPNRAFRPVLPCFPRNNRGGPVRGALSEATNCFVITASYAITLKKRMRAEAKGNRDEFCPDQGRNRGRKRRNRNSARGTRRAGRGGAEDRSRSRRHPIGSEKTEMKRWIFRNRSRAALRSICDCGRLRCDSFRIPVTGPSLPFGFHRLRLTRGLWSAYDGL